MGGHSDQRGDSGRVINEPAVSSLLFGLLILCGLCFTNLQISLPAGGTGDQDAPNGRVLDEPAASTLVFGLLSASGRRLPMERCRLAARSAEVLAAVRALSTAGARENLLEWVANKLAEVRRLPALYGGLGCGDCLL